MKKTLIIGSTVVDIIIQIEKLPEMGCDINTVSQEMKLGGCAFNVSEVLRLVGVPYILCSPTGTGPYGTFVQNQLEKKGIRCFKKVEEENGCCYCFVDSTGERTFISHHGAEYKFRKEWLDAIDLSDVDSVYVCGLELEVDTEGVILSWLEKHSDLQIYFALSSRINFINPEHVNRLMRLHPIVHLSDKEAELYTGRTNPVEAASMLAGYTDNTIILTSGNRGCLCYSREEDGSFRSIGVPTEDVVVKDTIGAGDAHIGALISYSKMGYGIDEAARLANKVSGAVVSISGASLSAEEFNALNVPVNR